MVKISSVDVPSSALCSTVANRERPARESGPSRGQAAPRRPSLASWGNLGRPFPSRTLGLRFLSPQKCPDKLQSKSSCGDPIFLSRYGSYLSMTASPQITKERDVKLTKPNCIVYIIHLQRSDKEDFG